MATVDVLSASGVASYEPKDRTPQLPSLRSNQGSYVDQSSTGWMRSTPTGTPLQEMRRRFREDGYIWVKNVIPREDVYDMREQYVSTLRILQIADGGANCLSATSPNSPIPACFALTHHHERASSTRPPIQTFTKASAAYQKKPQNSSSTPLTQIPSTALFSRTHLSAPSSDISQAGSKRSLSTAPCSGIIAPGARAPVSTTTNTFSGMAKTSSSPRGCLSVTAHLRVVD